MKPAGSKLVLASGNVGKLAELRRLLGDVGLALHAQSEFGLDEVEETAGTFVENALLKARHAARATGLPALADDSGLCVDALGGAPGPHSARYGGIRGGTPAEVGARNIERLLRELEGVPEAARTARFYCVLVLLRNADDPQPLIAEGTWEGRILEAARGDRGFGYDPVFFDPVLNCSGAELDPAMKNLTSHRGRAVAALKQRLASPL